MIRWGVMMMVLALASCAGTDKHEAPVASAAPPENVLGKLEGFRAQMCACNAGDKACASKVQRALGDFNDAHRDSTVPYHETKRIVQVGSEIERCEKRALQEDVLAVMARFRDEMCACTAGDNACAQRVSKEMQDYSEQHREVADMKISDEDMKKASDLGMAMAKCMSAAMGAGTP